MGNQIEQILKNLLKPENEKIKIRSEKKSKIDKKINQLIQKKKKQSGGGIWAKRKLGRRKRDSRG